MTHFLRRPGARSLRRAYPIHAYTGPNGGGKSAAMVWDTLPTLEKGRPVLSTVRLLEYENPRPCEGYRLVGDKMVVCEICVSVQQLENPPAHGQAHPGWIPFTSWDQLMAATFVDVLMDEVTGVASSRESMGLPAAVANKLVQLRRADVVVRWSSPAYMRADKILRECTQAVTFCQGSMSVPDGDADRQWRRRRLFKWKTYDAMAFEDFTSGKREDMESEGVSWHWGPGSPAFSAYDTLDAVLSIGTVSESGTCYRCGGRRARPACKCTEHHSDHAQDGAEAGAEARPEAASSTTPIPACHA